MMASYHHISGKDKIVKSFNLIVFFLKRQSFKFYFVGWYCFLGVFGGIFLCAKDGLGAIDGVFQAVAAATGAGLSTVSTLDLSIPSFVVLAFLMLVANCVFMLLPPMMYRQHCYNQLNKDIALAREKGLIKPYKELPEEDKQIIRDTEITDRALSTLTYIIMSYFFICLAVCTVVCYGTLFTVHHQDELDDRGFSRLDSAMYLAISAFANCGFTLTSDNIIALDNNPPAYIWLTLPILLGNTALPLALRWYVRALLDFSLFMSKKKINSNNNSDGRGVGDGDQGVVKNMEEAVEIDDKNVENPHKPIFANHNTFNSTYSVQKNKDNSSNEVTADMETRRYQQTLQYILDNPRKLTTTLFSHEQTVVLGITILLLIGLQYGCFLASTLDRPRALENHTRMQLVGLGYFQTLSTRSAGFAILDLRQLNQGLLVVYAIMMYISAIPFVATVKRTNENNKKDELTLADNDEATTLNAMHYHPSGTTSTPDKQKQPHFAPQSPELNYDSIYKNNVDSDATYGDDQSGGNNNSNTISNINNNHNFYTENIMHTNNGATNTGVESDPARSSDRPFFVAPVDQRFDDSPSSTTQAPPAQHLHRRRNRAMSVHSHASHNTRHSTAELTPLNALKEVIHNTQDQIMGVKPGVTTLDHEEVENTPISEMLKELFRTFFMNHQFLLLFSVIVCSFSEDQLITNPKFDCNLWYIVFEIVSAYGSSGLSVGMPGYTYSLSGVFSPLGKLVLIFVMILAKHRGLPEANDEVIDFQFAAYRTATGYEESMLYTTAAEIAAEEKKRGSGKNEVEMVEW